MAQKYEEEQTRLIGELQQTEAEYSKYQRAEQDMDSWVKRIKACLTIDSLTRAIVVELIEKIDVSEVYNINDEKSLDITIHYKFGLSTYKEKEPVKRNETNANPPIKLYA